MDLGNTIDAIAPRQGVDVGAKGKATQQRILDEAVQLASREGLENMSLGRLASAISMSKSGLFAHFRSKEALQLAVIDHAAALHDQVLQPNAKAEPGMPRLWSLIERWATYVDDSPFAGGCFFAACAAEFDDRQGPVHDRIVSHYRSWMGRLEGLVEEAVTHGDMVAKTDASQAAFELQGIGFAANWRRRLFERERVKGQAQEGFARLLWCQATESGRDALPRSPTR
jgi:AcrR family transcriptional regulator